MGKESQGFGAGLYQYPPHAQGCASGNHWRRTCKNRIASPFQRGESEGYFHWLFRRYDSRDPSDAGENLATTFASCDAFIFPSKSETFGQVVLEAQASGLPVIAFQAEGVCDIIQDGRTGWLVTPTSDTTEEAAFENAIAAVLANPEKRESASLEAVYWASNWRWSEAMEKAVESYREARRSLSV